MNITRLLVPSTIVLLVLAGCSKPAPEDNSTQAKDGIAEDAAVVAELNAPIAPADIDVAYKMVSGPTYDAATDLVSYQVEVTNSGRATLVSAGTMPVNFGVAIWDSNRSLKQSPPANQDYARISLPNRLASGKSVVLPVTFEVGPTLGGIVVLDGVQENVGWFNSYGKKVLTLGQFSRCNGVENTLCLADGTAVTSPQ
jgi:hypothetical protein